jgi:signal transduction histidine kinase
VRLSAHADGNWMEIAVSDNGIGIAAGELATLFDPFSSAGGNLLLHGSGRLAFGARGLGLYLIDRIGPLRRAVMREGVAPLAAQPRLMRGEVL